MFHCQDKLPRVGIDDDRGKSSAALTRAPSQAVDSFIDSLLTRYYNADAGDFGALKRWRYCLLLVRLMRYLR